MSNLLGFIMRLLQMWVNCTCLRSVVVKSTILHVNVHMCTWRILKCRPTFPSQFHGTLISFPMLLQLSLFCVWCYFACHVFLPFQTKLTNHNRSPTRASHSSNRASLHRGEGWRTSEHALYRQWLPRTDARLARIDQPWSFVRQWRLLNRSCNEVWWKPVHMYGY